MFANVKSSCSATASRSVNLIVGALRSVAKLLVKQTSKLRREFRRVSKHCKLFEKTRLAHSSQREPTSVKTVCDSCIKELLSGITGPMADSARPPNDLDDGTIEEQEVVLDDKSALVTGDVSSCLESKAVTDLSPANRFKIELFVARNLGLRKHLKKMIKKAPDCAYYVQRVSPPTCM